MSTPKARKRQPTAKSNPASALQATLDREEARRKTRVRRALVVLAAGLVVIAATAVVRGNAAAADRAAQASVATEQVASVVPSTPATEAQPADEPTAPTDAAITSPPTPKQAEPDSAKQAPGTPKIATGPPTKQNIRIGIGVTGYSPSTVTADAGSPIVLSVDRGEGCAAGFLMPSLDVAADNTAGPVSIDLGRVPAGSYQFTCGMEMIGGTLIVK